jgi:hypothetical protein
MSQYEPNPHLRRLDQIQAAKRKWSESEWLLEFLRTQNGTEPKIMTDEEILQWSQKLH